MDARRKLRPKHRLPLRPSLPPHLHRPPLPSPSPPPVRRHRQFVVPSLSAAVQTTPSSCGTRRQGPPNTRFRHVGLHVVFMRDSHTLAVHTLMYGRFTHSPMRVLRPPRPRHYDADAKTRHGDQRGRVPRQQARRERQLGQHGVHLGDVDRQNTALTQGGSSVCHTPTVALTSPHSDTVHSPTPIDPHFESTPAATQRVSLDASSPSPPS